MNLIDLLLFQTPSVRPLRSPPDTIQQCFLDICTEFWKTTPFQAIVLCAARSGKMNLLNIGGIDPAQRRILQLRRGPGDNVNRCRLR